MRSTIAVWCCAVAATIVCALPASATPPATFGCGAATASYGTDASGALVVDGPLAPLPAPATGAPLFPRDQRGHVAAGFSETGFDDPRNCRITQEDSARVSEQMGARIVRTTIHWPAVQPDGPSDALWERSDRTYAAYVARGIRPLWILNHTPRWAGADATTCRDDFCAAAPSADHMGDLGAFAAAVARRYPLSAGIELWNEPNLKPYWGGRSATAKPDAMAYAQMLAATYRGIHSPAGNGAMRLIAGALCGSCPDARDGTALSARTFAAGVLAWLKVMGAASSFDGFSVHLYPYDGDGGLGTHVVPELDALAAAFTQAGVPAPRLVVTETGATTGPTVEASRSQTRDEQRATLLSVYRALDDPGSSLPLAGNFDAVMFFTTVDYYTSPPVQSPADGGFGWLAEKDVLGQYVPKPVFCGFRTLLTGSTACGRITAG